jgi:hypothetical protein
MEGARLSTKVAEYLKESSTKASASQSKSRDAEVFTREKS